jgi:hypothetical protein
MPHYISLLFDVEDLCWPESDDITLELANRLTRHQVRGTFFVVAYKARQFAERGRTDIVQALEPHDLASHTTGHSLHPTIAEYLAGADWDDGVMMAMDREGEGLDILEQVFGRRPTSWGQPGGSWGPQINMAMRRLDMPVVVYPRTRTAPLADVHWYAGSLVFPGDALAFFDSALADDEQFEQALKRMDDLLDDRIMKSACWSGIFVCHPTRLRAVEFWDALNFAKGSSTAPQDYRMPTLRSDEAYQTALKNVDRLIQRLQSDRRLQIETIQDLSQTFRPPGEMVTYHQIDQAMYDITASEDILLSFYRFSPAELLDLVARAYTNTGHQIDSLYRRMVLGPTADPPPPISHDDFIYWDDFLSACQMVTRHVSQYARLPASIYLRGAQWSIGTFYRAAMEVWPLFRAAEQPKYIDWKPGFLYPSVGHEIAVAVQEDYENWPIHRPDVDLNKLLMHTCFQCWTLRPAYQY